ncbi:50S ribosomal protein L30 [Prevotella intermedia]|jgi:ribosomal protein L30|uniref:Large ribosomal subunit protein uL30 n=2 Tax=Prevotella intermedia TaxID=28131 RepID=A0A0H5B878_PREIN|nr:50S ribosomal protein L30 [Prevotella intermedia]AFJ08460.1 ribosomal protein L30 [Prevotella intermedia 17]APW32624.1 50S ribosomal protein L30 [Prevotella intermedia ATCC 25611 = DSM 20706]APW33975.1 50S ribosomal protein L30 [Prevotella intermedia]ATV25973.1 50S ribosomal protein L30 [Prevotella intermedia]ATV27821.1 50S ribosomal protein L30 [Prevotella intermedia]
MATIKVKQIKSRINAPKDQKATLMALGLRKISQIVEVEDTPSIRGMIRKVHHLVSVID